MIQRLIKYRATIVLGLLGLYVGGPWGGAIGALVGHSLDRYKFNYRKLWKSLWAKDPRAFFSGSDEMAFTTGIIVLSAKMAKSDGRVSRSEIAAFKRVFKASPRQDAAVASLFDRARMSAEDFEPFAYRLASTFSKSPRVLEEILSGLFIIAAADYNLLKKEEVLFLRRVAKIFGFNPSDFARIAARCGVELPKQSDSPDTKASEPYMILGVSENATKEELKSAYRSLMREHHPDKLIAQGVAPEYVHIATEKIKRINAAYDAICKAKGIK